MGNYLADIPDLLGAVWAYGLVPIVMGAGSQSLGRFGRWAARIGGGLLSPSGSRARLTILIYHRVLPHVDPVFADELDAASFDWHVELLARCFNILPLEEAVERLQTGSLPARAVCITFDDGYRDNHDVALPILKKWGACATFFVATGYLDGGYMWNDAIRHVARATPGAELDLQRVGLARYDISSVAARRGAARDLIGRLKYLDPSQRTDAVASVVELSGTSVPTDLMMSAAHVRALQSSGMSIGAHTATHPILARVDGATARREIEGGREALEGMVGRRVSLFAYPNGVPNTDYTRAHVDLVRTLGFKAAVSTAWGVARRAAPIFELPRFTPWDRTPDRFVARLLHNYLRPEPALAES